MAFNIKIPVVQQHMGVVYAKVDWKVVALQDVSTPVSNLVIRKVHPHLRK